MTAPGSFLTLEQVRAHLNLTTSTDDAELTPYLAAATRVVEDIVGPVLSREFTETHGGGPVVILDRYPVLEFGAVTAGGTALAGDAVDVDVDTGIVHRVDGGTFPGPVRVTYTAGRNPVPENINLAAQIIVAHLWETQRGPNITPEGEVLPAPGAGYALPNRARDLLAPDRRGPVLV